VKGSKGYLGVMERNEFGRKEVILRGFVEESDCP
jgi:hypothetical protein